MVPERFKSPIDREIFEKERDSDLETILGTSAFLNGIVVYLAEKGRNCGDTEESKIILSISADDLQFVDRWFSLLKFCADDLTSIRIDSICRLDIKVFLLSCVQWSLNRGRIAAVSDEQLNIWIAFVEMSKKQSRISTAYRIAITLAGLDSLRAMGCRTLNLTILNLVSEWLMNAAYSANADESNGYRKYAQKGFRALLESLGRGDLYFHLYDRNRTSGLFDRPSPGLSRKGMVDWESRTVLTLSKMLIHFGDYSKALKILRRYDSINKSREQQHKILMKLAVKESDTRKQQMLLNQADQLTLRLKIYSPTTDNSLFENGSPSGNSSFVTANADHSAHFNSSTVVGSEHSVLRLDPREKVANKKSNKKSNSLESREQEIEQLKEELKAFNV